MARKKAVEKAASDEELSQAVEGLTAFFFSEGSTKSQGEEDLQSYEQALIERLVGNRQQLQEKLKRGYSHLLHEVEKGPPSSQ